jgi:hypothetical protein
VYVKICLLVELGVVDLRMAMMLATMARLVVLW